MKPLPVLEGVDNFRDFGGYRTAHGRRLRRGRLLRSASHGRATDADLAALATIDIAVVVDLRRGSERERDPSRRHPGFRGRVIVNDEDGPDSWLEHIRRSDLSPAAFRDYLVGYYAAAPFEPRHVDLFRRYFEALETSDGAVLIHCAAGKDRTGLLAALTHHMAGVHRDDILADYLLTNDPGRIARRTPTVAQAIREASGRMPDEAAVRVALGVEAVYLETAFERIGDIHGGVDAYLRDTLGLSDTRRVALVERLLD
jgi:protein tyrosine/serine phosphatase